MFRLLRGSISRITRYSGAGEFSRRYAVMNAFDGIVTVLGIVLGSTLLGEASAGNIVAAGVGALIAMAVSGVSGTYMAEKAEQERRIRELEEAMLMKLDNSIIAEARKRAAVFSAIVDALAALMAGLVPLSPYFAVLSGSLTPHLAFYISLGLSLGFLFALGLFLGRIARSSMIVSGLKSLAIGVATILLITLLNLFL
ncbi:MAG: VIT1/CCC1 transporter family protein [Thaumarchaeota archaeon]|jgi:predicted membrane protein (TIGR00267 family)|nr:VIT1/CCC1 transporter family protein [Candidatus Wolframiiraptor allenii]